MNRAPPPGLSATPIWPPQLSTAVRARLRPSPCRPAGSHEHLEDPLSVARRHARPLVRHFHQRFAGTAARAHGDRAALRRSLLGVDQDVDERPLERHRKAAES